jgi:predicted HicB family RNase H-like nuclease
MKRIINGVTYNTDTSTLIAMAEVDHGANPYASEPAKNERMWLYQTRGGAFFLHTCTETYRRNNEGKFRAVTRDEFEPLSTSEAQHWVTGSRSRQVEIMNEKVFGEPPEAEAEETLSATLYTRMPASLKQQIETAAAEDKLSANAWVIRCTESCLANRKAKLTTVPSE